MQNFKEKLDIVEVIGSYIPLKRVGMNFSAPCPFHTERTGSFMVSPQRQSFCCFGCGEKGDVITFVQKFKKIDFPEAVNELCEKYDLHNPLKGGGGRGKFSALSKKMKSLSEVFYENLVQRPKIVEYLKKRGFEGEDLKNFAFGFCVGDEVLSIFSREEANELGLLNQKGNCVFSNRITITLFNKNFQPIGFAARTHPYANFSKAPKYINSKESFLYKKSENLYNFCRAKHSISLLKKVLIVEGYMDALSAIKLNTNNCVATGGTAFNKTFLAQLLPLEAKLYFLFDADVSGAQANLRALRVCFENGIYDSSVFVLKNGCKDLGECLESGKKAEFKEFSALEYFILYQFKNCQNPRQRDELVLELKKMVESEKNFYSRNFLTDEISRITNIQKDFFLNKAFKVSAKQDFSEFLAHLIDGDDNFYIAKNVLIVEALPKELQGAVSNFLQTRQKGELEKYDFIEKSKDFNFANEVFSINLKHLNALLQRARNQKDLEQILRLQNKIQEIKQNLEVPF